MAAATLSSSSPVVLTPLDDAACSPSASSLSYEDPSVSSSLSSAGKRHVYWRTTKTKIKQKENGVLLPPDKIDVCTQRDYF